VTGYWSADSAGWTPPPVLDSFLAREGPVVSIGFGSITGAALRAGISAIVVPFRADQPFWGGRVAALGVGPTPIPRRQLTSERVVAALSETLADARTRFRAADFGVRIRA